MVLFGYYFTIFLLTAFLEQTWLKSALQHISDLFIRYQLLEFLKYIIIIYLFIFTFN